MRKNRVLEIKKIDCLNAGSVELIRVGGDDMTAVEAARTSYRGDVESRTRQDNENLIDYLMRHEHMTPFEFADITFKMVMPIFVARQLIRHRTMSVNEESLRYVEARSEIYVPSADELRTQAEGNKQGSSSSKLPNFEDDIIIDFELSNDYDRIVYSKLLNTNLAKEVCRTVLPLGQYTCWYWKGSLRAVLGMLKLRLGDHVQYQTKVYAEAILSFTKNAYPITVRAWENHVLNAKTFSADEWGALQGEIDYGDVLLSTNYQCMRETRQREFVKKLGEVVKLKGGEV